MTPTANRELVAWAAEAYQLSTRRACHATGVARSLVMYRSCRPSQMPLRARLRELAGARVSWGYRRLYLLLRREGWTVTSRGCGAYTARKDCSWHAGVRRSGRP
ncbi:MAG: hypothetical protein IPN47_23540 [Gemmatimonadetes bacterium]|nr:hypothetical protein [Gemmatimonadota bacterium]